ncbi:MAG TPA: D-glycero-beta-D-manno-heptose-7-phosphate kinase [Bacteroidetes bacterium]|nr:D-glycero-beta-D-manno-heptose-7-phosphate kinase [Bacteroidota bacterium]
MVSTGTIAKLFNTFPHFRILVIGDVMIDSYMWGEVSRISPEAPIPILASSRRENRLGGAANVALNIQALGGIPILCSVIGEDDQGKLFMELMRYRGLETDGIIPDPSRITTRKTRIISRNQHLLRVDEENDAPLPSTSEERFIRQIEQIIQKRRIDCIVFEDYDKGVCTPAVIANTIKLAREKAIPVCVDPKRRHFNAYLHVTLFKPNFKELQEGLKTDLDKTDIPVLFDVCREYQKKADIQFMLVSLSEEGVFISNGKEYKVIPAHVRDVADVSGAGDTLIATAALCYVSGMDIFEMATVANIAGGLVCGRVGVVPVNREELAAECARLGEKS